MTTRAVYKYNVPVDGATHLFVIPGPSTLIHVDCQGASDVVQFWTEVPIDTPHGDHDHRLFQVFATGQVIPEDDDPSRYWKHVGSALTAGGALVWHLYELLTLEPF